jgi:hypothetical protein
MSSVDLAFVLEPVKYSIYAFQRIFLIVNGFVVSRDFILEDALDYVFGWLELNDLGDFEMFFFGLEAALVFKAPGLIE